MRVRHGVALLLASAAAGEFRPPAVPLVTSNPFLSIWSESDHLNGATTKHWTHREHSLVSLIRIDGKTYRLMGLEPKSVPPLQQKSVEVLPTRSIYDFEGAGVHVTMTFMQPALPDDLDVYSWPLSYITWLVRSADGNEHQVQLYDSTSSQLAVNNMTERVEWSRSSDAGPDAAARRHAQSACAWLLRRRPPHQLGLRLRRRFEKAIQGGDRRRQRRWRASSSKMARCRQPTTPTCRARSPTTSR